MKKKFFQGILAFAWLAFSLLGCVSKPDDGLSKLPINTIQNNGFVSIDFQKVAGVGVTWVKSITCSSTGFSDIFPKDGYQTVTLKINNDPANPIVNFQADAFKEYAQKNIFLLYNKNHRLNQTLQINDSKNIRIQPVEVYALERFDTIILDIVFEIPNDINLFAFNIVRQDKIDQFLGGCK